MGTRPDLLARPSDPEPAVNIAFLGTPAFAAVALEALEAAGHRILCLVAQPDRPAGRGQDLRAPATVAWARSRGVTVLQPEKVRDGALASALTALRPELLVVVAYGRILGRDLLEVAPRGAINVHASLLPRWRGAAPIQWALAEGDTHTGVTIMRMDEGLDTGDILLQRATPIGEVETSADLHDRLAALGGAALVEALPLLEAGALTPVRQDGDQATLAPVIEKEHGRLDFRRPAERLACRVRAFTPWPGAYTTLGGRTLKVHLAQVAEPWEVAALDPEHRAPGQAVSTERILPRRGVGDILVSCGEGSALHLLEVQLEGKRRMKAFEFLKGTPLPPDAVLGA